jgi:predicted ATPase
LEGELEDGAELVQTGFNNFKASGAELSLTHYYGVLAESHWASGRIADALTSVDDGLALVERSNERFQEANLHRLRGDLLLALSPDNRDAAEECYQTAIAVARRQAAKSWELRATMSLSRLWQQQGRTDEAREVLSGIYGWFTEGFSTGDLREAKSLLETL